MLAPGTTSTLLPGRCHYRSIWSQYGHYFAMKTTTFIDFILNIQTTFPRVYRLLRYKTRCYGDFRPLLIRNPRVTELLQR